MTIRNGKPVKSSRNMIDSMWDEWHFQFPLEKYLTFEKLDSRMQEKFSERPAAESLAYTQPHAEKWTTKHSRSFVFL